VECSGREDEKVGSRSIGEASRGNLQSKPADYEGIGYERTTGGIDKNQSLEGGRAERRRSY